MESEKYFNVVFSTKEEINNYSYRNCIECIVLLLPIDEDGCPNLSWDNLARKIEFETNKKSDSVISILYWQQVSKKYANGI